MTIAAPRPTIASLFLVATLLPACADDNGSGEARETEESSTGADDSDGDGTADDSGDSGDDANSEGADDESGDAPPGVQAARMALEPLVAAQCQHAFDCCNGDEMAFQLGPAVTDAAVCTSTILDVLEAGGSPPYLELSQISLNDVLPFFAYGLDAAAVVVDEDAFAACAEAIAGQPCAATAGSDGDNCVAPEVVQLDVCTVDQLFIGQHTAGEECSTYRGFECAPGLACEFFDAASGVCVETLSAGDVCFADYNCYGDLLCDFSTGTCIEPAGPGEPCAYADPADPQVGTETIRCANALVCDPLSETCGSQTCGFGASCDGDEQCPAGLSCVQYRCDLPAVVGESCHGDGDCDSGLCIYTGVASVCQEPVGNGEPCQEHRQCASEFCDPGAGQCAATIAVGSACDPVLGAEQCTDGYCDGVDCVAFGDIGDACPAVQCNYIDEEQCWDGTCQAFPLPDGATCGSAFDCQSGSCSTVCQPAPAIGDACTLGGCGSDSFCELSDGSDGTCQARRERGALCTSHYECWGGCEPRFGELRCYGNGPAAAFCDGV